jgi:NADH-quinone oxidoreductase subunit N
MTVHDLVRILPMLVIAATLTFITLFIAFRRNHLLTCILALAGISIAFLTLPIVSAAPLPFQVTSLIIMDRYAVFYIGLILAGAFAVTILSYEYLRAHTGKPEEYYVLLLIATLGAMVLAASSHFASFFLGLETLSIPLYILIAYPLTKSIHIEAGIKYLILSAVSASFLVFGMALVYAQLGTMDFVGMASATSAYPAAPLVLAGFAMMIAGIGFKLAFVPFHLWTPDVYEGAPAPVTAFIATVSKGAMFALLLRFFTGIPVLPRGILFLIFSIIAIASMFAGNLLALLQNNVKRLLAYSSIAHFGYLLIAFLSAGPLRVAAVAYYLVAYFITTIGTFGIVTLMSLQKMDADGIGDYSGLYSRRPWLAIAFTLMLLSLAGIPLTAGFIGKFYIMSAGVGSALWALVTILVINSVIGLYYYLRVLAVMFVHPAEDAPVLPGPALAGSLVIGVLVVLLIWWGVYPAPLIDLVQKIGMQ